MSDTIRIEEKDLPPAKIPEKFPDLITGDKGFGKYEIPDNPIVFTAKALRVIDSNGDETEIPDVKILLSHGIRNENGQWVFLGNGASVVDTVKSYNSSKPGSEIEAVIVCNPQEDNTADIPIHLSEFRDLPISHAVGSDLGVNIYRDQAEEFTVIIRLKDEKGALFGFENLAVSKDINFF